jgi:hypothetical protein
VLYHTYDVDRRLLQAAFTALTERAEPITMDEGRELGVDTVVQLATAREIARAPSKKARSPVNLTGVDLQALINTAFQLPTAGAANGGTT